MCALAVQRILVQTRTVAAPGVVSCAPVHRGFQFWAILSLCGMKTKIDRIAAHSTWTAPAESIWKTSSPPKGQKHITSHLQPLQLQFLSGSGHPHYYLHITILSQLQVLGMTRRPNNCTAHCTEGVPLNTTTCLNGTLDSPYFCEYFQRYSRYLCLVCESWENGTPPPLS